MRQIVFLFLISASCAVLPSCKNSKQEPKDSDKINTTIVDSNNAFAPLPPDIVPEEALRRAVAEVVRDYPGVSASVNNGTVVLKGSVDGKRLPKLMQAIHSLNPKKIQNELKIQ